MRIEYHRTLLADRVRNAAFHAALAAASSSRARRRWPTSARAPASWASWRPGWGPSGSTSTRRPKSPPSPASCCATTACPTAASPRCTRPTWPRPSRVDVVVSETLGNYPFEENIIATLNDARERFLKPGRRDHSAQRRAVRLPRDGRAPLSRAGGLGRGRLRPRFRPGQGHEPQQHLRALAGAGRPARRRRRGQARGTRCAFDRKNKTTRAGEASWQATPRRPRLRPGAVVVGGAGSPACASRPGRSTPRTHWEQLYLPALAADRRRGRARRCAPACDPPRPSTRAPT